MAPLWNSPAANAILTVLLVAVTVFQFCLSQDTTPDSQITAAPSTPTGSVKETGTDVTSSDVVTKEVPPEFSFAVWNNEGKICILAKFSATFTVTYPSVGGEQTASVNLPEKADSKGRCGKFRQEPVLELSWPGFRLSMTFTAVKSSKASAVPDAWELMSMELTYNTASSLFDGATNAGKQTARSQEEYPLFHTPFGKSYFCPSPDVVPMYNLKKDRVVLARLQDVRLQVYDVQKGKFSPVQRCSLVRIGGVPEPFALDETVPIAVGSTLAVMSVLVILGYALYRNLAVRKTDYNYME